MTDFKGRKRRRSSGFACTTYTKIVLTAVFLILSSCCSFVDYGILSLICKRYRDSSQMEYPEPVFCFLSVVAMYRVSSPISRGESYLSVSSWLL